MKPPTRAPFYACLYHALCDVARKHGYALAIHGTVTTDLDVIAVPWVKDCSAADELIEALREHIGRVTTVPDELKCEGPERRPHGRLAWNLYMDFGAKVDVSVTTTLHEVEGF